MTMRINHNVSALNSWRNLNNSDMAMSKTLERLSSGEKITRAADGPASLVISEQMRAQIGSMEQAVGNSEIAISMVQTTEAALNEVNSILVGMRQLAIHASNEGANDSKMLAADQAEISNSLETIDRIARQAQFGNRFLLDGSNGLSGFTVGEDLRFITAGKNAKDSPAEGYEVDITQVAKEASMEGVRTMTAKEVQKGGISFNISEGGRTISYTSKPGDTIDIIKNQLSQKINVNGLKLDLEFTPKKALRIVHKDYGSNSEFTVAINADGLLSKTKNEIEGSISGQDIAGTIGGDLAYGSGQFLTAAEGTSAEGTSIQYTGILKTKQENGNGTPVEPQYDAEGNIIPISVNDTFEGFVNISNNALKFQVGANVGQTVSIALPNANTNQLSKSIDNESSFKSLAEINVENWQGAQDSMILIDDAIDQISSIRADLGAFQKNTLESNMSNLRYATENLIAAESSIRDTDMAKEMSEFTKNQILLSSGTAMLGQANQIPKAVLSLLNSN